MNPPSGFTLVLDGLPEEVERILAAVGREYRQIEAEALRPEEWTFSILAPPYLLPRSSLRGRLEMRFDAHGSLLERARPSERTFRDEPT